MTIKAVVFDIGGVLEITPDLGLLPKWETKLNLEAGALGQPLGHVWEGGSLGTIHHPRRCSSEYQRHNRYQPPAS